MVNPTTPDTAIIAQSAQQMGELLMNANDKKMGLIDDMLSMRAEAIQQAPAVSGLGEGVDAVA